MARRAVIDAVEARLAEHWTRCPVIGINTAQADPPADGSEYLVVQYPVANNDQRSIGAPEGNIFREEGAIRFVLHGRRGYGVADYLDWCEELAALFRAKDFGGMTSYAPSSPAIDDLEHGAYILLSFACPYKHDLIAPSGG
ncbi:MAG TPA: phage tail terminator-like protein [Beijerinckiaceae bacterium]|nr:phage tail terminator-like protein [Beijerinckiaceae bacterium]